MSNASSDNPSKAKVFGARLFSTLLLWGIVTAVFVSGNVWLFIGLLTLLGLLGVKEYFDMTREGGVPAQAAWVISVSVLYLLILGWILGTGGHSSLESLHGLDAAFVILILMGGFLLQMRRAVDGLSTLTSLAVSGMGFVYITLMFSFMSRLLFVPEHDAPVPGAWLVIWLVAVTKFTDMGAYITGSLIGKHKMIPHISPKKTWQGFAGGLFFAQLAGCGLFALLPAELAVLGGWCWVIGLGLVLSLLAVIGDLAESVIKRSMNIKDSGKALPGIGGALDLIDSLCFTAPVLYFALKWLPVCSSCIDS